jgi:uncharacterized membrane protein YeaQ/YmgE (transglycosylase-associated protein family)
LGFISRIAVGAIEGLLNRRIVPNPDPGRSVVAVILVMAGASVGGFVLGVPGRPRATDFKAWSIFVAPLGAVPLLCVCGHGVRWAA